MVDSFSLPHMVLIAILLLIFLSIPYWVYRSIKKNNKKLTEIEKSIKRIEKNQSGN